MSELITINEEILRSIINNTKQLLNNNPNIIINEVYINNNDNNNLYLKLIDHKNELNLLDEIIYGVIPKDKSKTLDNIIRLKYNNLNMIHVSIESLNIDFISYSNSISKEDGPIFDSLLAIYNQMKTIYINEKYDIAKKRLNLVFDNIFE